MADIIPFKKPKPAEKLKNRALCRSGFHKWKPDTTRPFDVKSGRLVTVFRCQRCGAVKNELT